MCFLINHLHVYPHVNTFYFQKQHFCGGLLPAHVGSWYKTTEVKYSATETIESRGIRVMLFSLLTQCLESFSLSTSDWGHTHTGNLIYSLTWLWIRSDFPGCSQIIISILKPICYTSECNKLCYELLSLVEHKDKGFLTIMCYQHQALRTSSLGFP